MGQTDPLITFWAIQGPGWLLAAYLVFAQATAALNYRWGVALGTQEPADRITEVGAAAWWAFAFGDLVCYLPLLILGLVGHWAGTGWSDVVLAAALGITVYWPIVCLATVWRARGAPGWDLPREWQYWVVLPLITSWGVLGLLFILGQIPVTT